MASHRKPRTRILQSATSRRGAIGVTTAALASVSLLSQSASATPSDGKDKAPSIAEVKKKVDRLYQQAESSTQKYNSAKEKTDSQRRKVDDMIDQAAKRTEKLNDARRVLGNYATAQYRTGGMSQTATLLLTQNPQRFFEQTHVLDRMSGRQKNAVTAYEHHLKEAKEKRQAAAKELDSLSSSQRTLAKDKRAVQAKLAEARHTLSKLTAAQKARMAKLERERQEKARKAAERAEEQRRKDQQHKGGGGSGSSDTPSGSTAEKVLSFARSQLGKPYVWGATGPNSYDCSGLTQDAYKAAGVSLPRTTWDQVKAGKTVSKSQLQPGDLVFFFKDISHVGIYVGNGQVLHAPHPGANVRYESMAVMPFYSAVRPG